MRFAADENLNDFIVRGLLCRHPDLDIVRIRDTEMREADDPAVLEWAAVEGRVLLPHDVSTLTKHACERVRVGKRMAGVFQIGHRGAGGGGHPYQIGAWRAIFAVFVPTSW